MFEVDKIVLSWESVKLFEYMVVLPWEQSVELCVVFTAQLSHCSTIIYRTTTPTNNHNNKILPTHHYQLDDPLPSLISNLNYWL